MRREGASRFVPSDAITDISTFQGVVSIVLKDGEYTREEKRLVIKLANLLLLEEDAPKRGYDAIDTYVAKGINYRFVLRGFVFFYY